MGFSTWKGEASFVSTGAQVAEVPWEEMIFEIGSITKVFTSILLCLLVEQGKVDPEAPLREISDDLAVVPDWITPESLASHSSGLPRIHVPIWKALLKPLPDDLYAECTRADRVGWFGERTPMKPHSRRRNACSNLGIGLLGEAMPMSGGKALRRPAFRKGPRPARADGHRLHAGR